MPVSNGRIYVDTTVTPNIGVSIADVQRLVPVTIKRTVNGVEERRSSGDEGVLCGGSVGDTVQDNAGGTAWTISARIEVNPLSRFKPVSLPVFPQASYNMLSGINFGLQLLSNNINWGSGDGATLGKFVSNVCEYVRYCNGSNSNFFNGWNKEGNFKYVKPRGGQNSVYRIHDFVCKENPYNYGYYHKADWSWGPWSDLSLVLGAGMHLGTIHIDEEMASGDSKPLPDDTAILQECRRIVTSIPSSGGKVAFLCVSAAELAANNMDAARTWYRGVILVDATGQDYFLAIGSIPWGEWKNGSSEYPIAGEWTRIEFYTTLSPTNYKSAVGRYNLSAACDCLAIPGFKGQVVIDAGNYGIIFQADTNENGSFLYMPGVPYTTNNRVNKVKVAFRLASGNVDNWADTLQACIGESEGSNLYYPLTKISTLPKSGDWYIMDFGQESTVFDMVSQVGYLTITGRSGGVGPTLTVHVSEFVIREA